MIKLYSFDIYDTLITRKTATPNGIFALMQKCLLGVDAYREYPSRLRQNFYLIRQEAEKVARNTYVVGEVKDITLQQIYEAVSVMEGLSPQQTAELMALEVALEKDNVLPIRINIEKVKKLTEEGNRVVLISNMYLEESDIRDILVSMDAVFADMTIYVSGGLGKTKGTHTLYRYVREQEQVAFAEWKHFGDHLDLDIKIPKQLGMEAEHLKSRGLLAWEEALIKLREDNAQLQLLMGVSRNMAANFEGINDHTLKSTISYRIGHGFSAHLLLPYVIWVLNESIKKGIHKLYFIARDGYILKKIADILIASYQYPIETAYIYGSRKAWRLPSINEKFDLQEYFLWNYPGQIRTYERIAEILGMTLEELQQFLPCAKAKRNLSPQLVNEMIEILAKRQKEIGCFICEKYKERRKAAAAYLQQEIDVIGENFAFVDLIGSGYTQKCLGDLVRAFMDIPVCTFFYRLDTCKKSERNINHSYFSNRLPMSGVIETLCGAPHGQTEGYEQKEGRWEPVLGQDEGQLLEAYGYADYLKGIEEYTKTFAELYNDGMPKLDDLSAAAEWFEYLVSAENKELYDYIADMPYGMVGNEKKVASFAPRITDKELRDMYFLHKGERKSKYYKGHSLEFSLKRLTLKQKRRLSFYEKHGDDLWIKWMRDHFLQEKISTSRYELLAPQVVIYGAGKRGQLLYMQLTAQRKDMAKLMNLKVDQVPKVSLWLDKNYENYQKDGLKVASPAAVLETKYQQIVIATAIIEIAQEIEKELMGMGIQKGKIIWLNPQPYN